MAQQQDSIEYTALRGGLDLESSSLTIQPGRALDLHNFEPTHGGGYRRIYGYERYNGLDPALYDGAIAYGVLVLSATTGLAVGKVLVGNTSGAIGAIALIDGTTVVVNHYAGATAFTPTELLKVAPDSNDASVLGSLTVTSYSARVAGSTNDAIYISASRAWVRDYYYTESVSGSMFADLPGSGPVRGVTVSSGGEVMYAFRDNAGATSGDIYWASVGGLTGGWDKVPMPYIIKFDGGSGTVANFVNAATITGGTSGSTFRIDWIVPWSGTDGEGDAAGYLVGALVTGTGFVDNEQLKTAGVSRALAMGDGFTYARDPGGKCEFAHHDFVASSVSTASFSYPLPYVADGVNEAGILFGTQYYFPILFPSATDAPAQNNPKYIEVHKNYLFLGFENGSLQHSILGDGTTFNGFLGAAEFNMGDKLTGIKSITGGGLAIYTRRRTFLLTGDSVANWALTTIGEKTGAIDYTVQSLGQIYSLDDYGLTNLQRVQAYGDFDAKPLSRDIQKALDKRVIGAIYDWYGTTTTVVGSIAVRRSNQYRLFLNDGSGIIWYLNPKGYAEASTFKLGFTPYCVYACRMSDGKERIFAGDSTSGRVYELDRGYSFDGANIYSVARLPFNHQKTPRLRKSYRQLELETELTNPGDSGEVSLTIYAELDFGSIDNSTVIALGADIGKGMDWELIDGSTTYWTTAQEKATSVELDGTGNNISLTIVCDSAIIAPFTIQGLVLRYRPRRADRS